MRTHAIIGAGQVGRRLARSLIGNGESVRVVSRRGTSLDGARVISADAADRESLLAATTGADVIYNCVNPAYHSWQEEWPPIANNLIEAAEHADAVLVTLSNLYGYGPVDHAMTEETQIEKGENRGARDRGRPPDRQQFQNEHGSYSLLTDRTSCGSILQSANPCNREGADSGYAPVKYVNGSPRPSVRNPTQMDAGFHTLSPERGGPGNLSICAADVIGCGSRSNSDLFRHGPFGTWFAPVEVSITHIRGGAR